MTPTVHRLNTCLPLTLAALVLLAALSGCGEPPRGLTHSGELRAQWVDLPDGRVVTCVTTADQQAGGIDCDWANAAREGEG